MLTVDNMGQCPIQIPMQGREVKKKEQERLTQIMSAVPNIWQCPIQIAMEGWEVKKE